MRRTYAIKSRSLFDCNSAKPFKVSRSQIEAYIECPRCFYLNHRKGIGRPSSPPFTINMLVDRMLKKEFDAHRAAQTTHPIMSEHGLDAVPFRHPMIDEWRNNFKGMVYLDERTNLKITGALDDIWQMRDNGKLFVIDYKATAKDGEVTLDDEWKITYKRQMEVYIWLLRKQGFEVDDRGFFLYANGDDAENFDRKIGFTVSLLPYTGNTDWIEPKQLDIKACLTANTAPAAPDDCEFCGYIAANRNLENGHAPGAGLKTAAGKGQCQQLYSGTPPWPPLQDAEAVAALHPRDHGTVLDLTGDNELPGVLDERQRLKAELGEREERVAVIDGAIKVKLGDAAEASLPGWKITYRTQRRAEHVVRAWEGRVLKVTDRREKKGRAA